MNPGQSYYAAYYRRFAMENKILADECAAMGDGNGELYYRSRSLGYEDTARAIESVTL